MHVSDLASVCPALTPAAQHLYTRFADHLIARAPELAGRLRGVPCAVLTMPDFQPLRQRLVNEGVLDTLLLLPDHAAYAPDPACAMMILDETPHPQDILILDLTADLARAPCREAPLDATADRVLRLWRQVPSVVPQPEDTHSPVCYAHEFSPPQYVVIETGRAALVSPEAIRARDFSLDVPVYLA